MASNENSLKKREGRVIFDFIVRARQGRSGGL